MINKLTDIDNYQIENLAERHTRQTKGVKSTVPERHTLQSLQTPLTSRIWSLQTPCILNPVIKKYENTQPRAKTKQKHVRPEPKNLKEANLSSPSEVVTATTA